MNSLHHNDMHIFQDMANERKKSDEMITPLWLLNHYESVCHKLN